MACVYSVYSYVSPYTYRYPLLANPQGLLWNIKRTISMILALLLDYNRYSRFDL